MTKRGTVQSGGREELKFEFLPSEQGCMISELWTLSIPEADFKRQILLQGIHKEPSISMDPATLDFGSLICGTKSKTKFQILNKETTPLSFKVIDPKPDNTTKRLLGQSKKELNVLGVKLGFHRGVIFIRVQSMERSASASVFNNN